MPDDDTRKSRGSALVLHKNNEVALTQKLARDVANYSESQPETQRELRMARSIAKIKNESNASLCRQIGVGGGSVISLAIAALLPSATVVTTAMMAASAIGAAILFIGLWGTRFFSKRAAIEGILIDEYKKVDDPNDPPRLLSSRARKAKVT